MRFSEVIVFTMFTTFLLPLWSLSFATEALGGDRENNSMIWLLSRPMPRPAIYLAKFVALLPWSLGLNVGGFALLNQGLYETIGRTWYKAADASDNLVFTDFLAYAFVNLLRVVDVLNLAQSHHLLHIAYVQASAWPASVDTSAATLMP